MRLMQALAAASLVLAYAAGQAQDIRATINGTPVHFSDVQPKMFNGRVMVPMRGVFEQMGASVFWHPETRTVTVRNGSTEIRLPIGATHATINGNRMELDAPARLFDGRTMVPLRFTSEAMNANVDWIAETRTVAITTTGVEARPILTSPPGGNPINPPAAPLRRTPIHIDANTVIPFQLDTPMSSKSAKVGDKFRAVLDPPNDMDSYQDLPKGTVLEGRVTTVKAKSGNTPGVLGLDFDRIRLPDGGTFAIDGSLIGLDSKSVETENGRIVAKAGAKNDNLKYVGIGAGAGLLLSVLGKGDALTNALIGGALGFLFGEIQRQNEKPRDVELDAGTKFGVRLTRDLHITEPKTRAR